MVSIARKANVLKAVAAGKTLKSAGEEAGVSSTRARQWLSTICRELRLPDGVQDIRANKDEYLTRLAMIAAPPSAELEKRFVRDLMVKLKLRDVSTLTPRYVSNLTASDLFRCGCTLVAVVALQGWLKGHGLSLKRRPPETDVEVKEVLRAIRLLDVYQFDTAAIEAQWEHFSQLP